MNIENWFQILSGALASYFVYEIREVQGKLEKIRETLEHVHMETSVMQEKMQTLEKRLDQIEKMFPRGGGGSRFQNGVGES